MTTRPVTQRLSGESGFTFVEVLVAMTLGLIVMLAILNVFDGFSANAARQTKITAANEQVRFTMDRIVRDVRQAGTVEVADPNDLVYTVSDSGTAVRRERICLDSAGRLWRSRVTTSTAPATPIASATACPTAGSGAFLVTTQKSANSTANPLFTYDSTGAGSVRNIGLTFSLNAGNPRNTDTTTLRASAFVRAKSETALVPNPGDISVACSTSGVPTLTLSAGVGPLSVSYTDMNGNPLAASTAAGSGATLPSGKTSVLATITAASGAVSKIVKTIAC